MSQGVLLRGVDQAALVAALTRALRRAGVTVGLTGAQACVRALARTHPRSTDEIYWAARVTLVSRYEDLAAFDRVFTAAFGDSVLPVDPHARREQALTGSDDVHVAATRANPAAGLESSGLPWATLPPVRDEGDAELGDLRVPERLPSAVAGLADTPFERFEDADLAVLERWLCDSLSQWPTRRTRRQRTHPAGASVALRATVARARRTGWEPVHLVRSRPQDRPRRLVMICDVSQSMQAHTRAYLHLMRACVSVQDNEVFAFATTLTRLTAALRNASAQVALERATEQVVDRFGGTKIATNLRALLTSHRGNTLRGAIVLIASDGWDSDDPDQLATVMAQLHRRAHRVLWLNPRAAAPGYEPRVGSMSAALPWCDEFLPAHDIGALADVLTAIRAAR
ncbi:MAG: VWA domain-containing protein [Actinomycetota bacterium]|nr:VWA domain-containing protein [Actinomycetota bacterium]